MPHTLNTERPVCLLVDNGSLRASAQQLLRGLGVAIREKTGATTCACSLKHTVRVDPAELDGCAAELLVDSARRLYGQGARQFVVVPYLIGPLGEISSFLNDTLEGLEQELDGACFALAPCLFAGDVRQDTALALMLKDYVMRLIHEKSMTQPRVLLVDHGSPRPTSTFARNYIGGQLSALLAEQVSTVAVATMEEYDDPALAFNRPSLRDKLSDPTFAQGDVILAMLFLSHGKHAGQGGDVARICEEATAGNNSVQLHRTPVLGEHPDMVELLVARYEEATKRIR